MLAPVGLRFGSLRPATGSRHLPRNGARNHRIRRLQPRTPEPSEAQPHRGEHRNGAGQPRRL